MLISIYYAYINYLTLDINIGENYTLDFKHDDYKMFYRGEQNYSWKLVPSLIRNELENKKTIKYEDLYRRYLKSGMIEKYCEWVKNISYLDNEFLSLMQHSISYSPYIDLTSDKDIAYTFALNKASINTYLNMNSSIYYFICKKDMI